MYIDIYRETPTTRLVSWADASVLKASDMTVQQVQELHILEEATDWAKDNAIVTMDGGETWNARNRRITNVKDPVDNQDAVTKIYMETVGNGFIVRCTALEEEATKQATAAAKSADSANKAMDAAVKANNNCQYLLGEVEDVASQALIDIASAKTDATTTINNLKTTTIDSITTYRNGAISAITSEKSNSLLEMANKQNTALHEIVAARDSATSLITATKNNAVNDVVNIKDKALYAVKQQEGLSVQAVKDAQKLTTGYLEGYINNAKNYSDSAAQSAAAARDDADAIREIAGGIQDTRIYPWKIEDGAMCIVVTERKEQLYV